MSDWLSRGSDSRDVGVCHFCNEEATHFDDDLYVDICDNQQCVESALAYTNDMRDLIDVFGDNDMDELEGEEDINELETMD